MDEQKNEIDLLTVQHNFKIQDQKNNNEWKSCCGRIVDKRAIQYFTQITIISITMIFSFYQLITVENCEAQHVYIGLLTMLLGVLIPNPKFNK
jgi:hypothetical protein